MRRTEEHWREFSDRAHRTLADIKQRLSTGRITRAEINILREKLTGLGQTLDRINASHQLGHYINEHSGNGHRQEPPGEADGEDMIDQPTRPSTRPETGGQRRPAGHLHGVPWYDSEDGATWQ